MQVEAGYVLIEYPSRDGRKMLMDAYNAQEVAIALDTPLVELPYLLLASVKNGEVVMNIIQRTCTPETYALTSWEE